MLLFWFCAALLTVAVVLALTRSIVASARDAEGTQPRSAADVAVYREQLSEIESDKARGLISPAEAEAARIEIARRLLASAETGADPAATTSASKPIPSPPGSERLFVIVAAAVPAIALGLYLSFGSPGLPGRPIAERLARAPAVGADVEELVARVEAQLRANPADGKGWDVIAPVYLRLERFRDAAEAYRRSLDLNGEAPRRLAGLAESTVLANDGIVSEVARKAYQRLLELEPGRMEARFGLALAMEQDGDLAEAAAAYRALLADTPPQAPWRQFVMERLETLAAKQGDAGGAPMRGPGPAEAEAIAGLPEGQRREVILQMVEGLAKRLETDGKDLAGWQRLLRSWAILGEGGKAEAALDQARKALAGDDKSLSEINAFAKNLGLKS